MRGYRTLTCIVQTKSKNPFLITGGSPTFSNSTDSTMSWSATMAMCSWIKGLIYKRYSDKDRLYNRCTDRLAGLHLWTSKTEK